MKGSLKRLLFIKLIILTYIFILGGCTSSPFFDPPEKVEVDEKGVLKTAKGPYQVYLRPGEMLIGAEFPKTEKAFVKYWPVDDPMNEKTAEMTNSWESIFYAHITNLPLEKKYRFSVCIDQYSCEFLSSKAGVKRETPFEFLVIGDSRAWDHQPHKRLIQLMKKSKADFYIHLGDMVTYGDSAKEWQYFFDFEKPLYQKIPLVPVIGNHDLSRRRIFSRLFLPMKKEVKPERYFSFSYGNSFFVVADTNVSIPIGGPQHVFLEKEFERAKKENFEHIFVLAHHPAYSSGWHGIHDDVHETLVPLAEKYGAKVYFAGHDHHYERSYKLKGVTHIVSGGGGSPLRGVKPKKFSAFTKETFQFMSVMVDGKKVKMRAIDVEGKVIDEVEL